MPLIHQEPEPDPGSGVKPGAEQKETGSGKLGGIFLFGVSNKQTKTVKKLFSFFMKPNFDLKFA